MTDCIICILLVVDLGLERVKDGLGGGVRSKGAEPTKDDNGQKKEKDK